MLNFDHVFVEELKGGDWHGWYGLPGALERWSCDGEVFAPTTTAANYPPLQALSSIRPTAMLSPNAFGGRMNESSWRSG